MATAHHAACRHLPATSCQTPTTTSMRCGDLRSAVRMRDARGVAVVVRGRYEHVARYGHPRNASRAGPTRAREHAGPRHRLCSTVVPGGGERKRRTGGGSRRAGATASRARSNRQGDADADTRPTLARYPTNATCPGHSPRMRCSTASAGMWREARRVGRGGGGITCCGVGGRASGDDEHGDERGNALPSSSLLELATQSPDKLGSVVIMGLPVVHGKGERSTGSRGVEVFENPFKLPCLVEDVLLRAVDVLRHAGTTEDCERDLGAEATLTEFLLKTRSGIPAWVPPISSESIVVARHRPGVTSTSPSASAEAHGERPCSCDGAGRGVFDPDLPIAWGASESTRLACRTMPGAAMARNVADEVRFARTLLELMC
ncbi:hypothetical protein FB107DRAFT_252003 [Schizophyllum commune]